MDCIYNHAGTAISGATISGASIYMQGDWGSAVIMYDEDTICVGEESLKPV